MNDSHFQQKQPGHLKLGVHAIFDYAPTHVHFSDHSLPMRNAPNDADFVTGAYGTDVNGAWFMAAEHARRAGMQSFRIMLHYQVRGGMPGPGVIDRDDAHKTGFLHMGRLARCYREEVRELLMDYLSSIEPRAAQKFKDAPLREILLRRPEFAYVLLREDPQLDVIVHPAMLAYNSAPQGKAIYVATVRAARAAEMRAQVVHLENSVLASGGRSH